MKTFFKSIAIVAITIMTSSCNANAKSEFKGRGIELKHTEPSKKQFIKVALLLDTSNSMDGLIDQAKAQLWEIVNELSYAKCDEIKPSLQIALYEYGNDRLNSDEGYIRQVIGFSSDLDEISKELFSLTTNGGNEYCGYVLNTSLNQLSWGNNENDLKMIFIAGNEPFTQGRIHYKDAAKKAHNNDVTVNTIFCGDYDQGISTYWKDGADLTHGDYMAINHNKATVHIVSPYDDKILELNNRLNKTYVAYGKLGNRKMALQSEQDSNAESYSKANGVSRAVSKSSHIYKNSSWDLIDAEKSSDFDYEKLSDEDLPKELKGKSKTEIKQFIIKKREDRKLIKEEIQTLNLKRKGYIQSKSKTDNGLESAMLKAIKSQAKKKNYKW